MATLKDVARESGLTVTTVSRVLNNRGYISDDARKKVKDAMEKLNYRPNELARSLHSKNTNIIGVIVPHIRHPYFAEMISNFENEAYKKGYRILLCSTQCIDEKEKHYIEICTSNRVAGILLCSATVDVDTFINMDIPVITMERYLDNGTAAVECDNRSGGELAAKCLIDAGCTHLLHIGSTRNVQMPADKRGEGFRSVCEQNGIEFVEMDPEEINYNKMTYMQVIEDALKDHPETDGIFASSDVIAAQVLQVCRKLGISVPEQIKIVGFDDVSVAELTTPQLTTIRQPVKQMAELAVGYLVDAVEGKMVPKQTILPVTLVERETT